MLCTPRITMKIKVFGEGISMFDISVIFKLAGLGICITVINILLDKADAKEWKFPISVVGVIMGLLVVLDYIRTLFEVVQTFAM